MSEIEVKNDCNILGSAETNCDNNDSFLNDHLKMIDNDLLKNLSQKLSYGGSWDEDGWKNFFGKVGWNKEL
jgi:hypothetical protein